MITTGSMLRFPIPDQTNNWTDMHESTGCKLREKQFLLLHRKLKVSIWIWKLDKDLPLLSHIFRLLIPSFCHFEKGERNTRKEVQNLLPGLPWTDATFCQNFCPHSGTQTWDDHPVAVGPIARQQARHSENTTPWLPMARTWFCTERCWQTTDRQNADSCHAKAFS